MPKLSKRILQTTDSGDYVGSSTIVGWSSFTAEKHIYVIKMGDMVTVNFNIAGVSDDTVATFTVPYTAITTTQTVFENALSTTYNNSGYSDGQGRIYISSATNIITLKNNQNGVWTNENNKQVAGTLIFKAV